MTTIDDLRRTLEGQADRAPAATGLIEAARTGAVRIHRRRRITAMITAAVIVVAAAVAVPVALRLNAAPVAPAFTGPREPIGRKAQEMTLAIDPSFGTPIISRLAAAERQRIDLAKQSGSKVAFSAHVQALEPWFPHATDLPPNAIVDRVTVAGHAADYVTAPPAARGGQESYSVRWIDPSGVVVQVAQGSGSADRARLLALAAATHLGPAHPLLMPFQIARIPAGMRVVTGWVSRQPFDGMPASLGLSSRRDARAQNLRIAAADKVPLNEVAGAGGVNPTPVAAIGGRRAWMAAEQPGSASPPRNTESLVVDAGPYWVIFTSTPDMSAEQVRRVASGTTFATSTNESSWMVPVG